MGDRLEPRYFAVLDPQQPDRMTYWRRTNGLLKPWPLKAKHGPILWTKPGPGHVHVTPPGLSGEQRREWVRGWYATVRGAWMRQVQDTIAADPSGCARRFAEFAIRCCVCARALTEDFSKVVGVGPECRHGVPADVLAAFMTPQVAKVHAEEAQS